MNYERRLYALWWRISRKKRLNYTALKGSSSGLDRCLSTFDLTALGIGATLGVGIYVLAGSVAKDIAGPSVIFSFAFAAFASGLSGLCYAELGSRVPLAGSAYAYSYVSVGELAGYVIGWNLILEYSIGTASVARAYSGYLDSLLNNSISSNLRYAIPMNIPYMSPYPDFVSLFITLTLAFILSIGVKESSKFNNVFASLNLCIVGFVIISGLFEADFKNWNLSKDSVPLGDGGFFPYGISGTLAGAATCFYGFVGFDAIATSGEEALNPQKSIPRAVIFSLGFVFVAYLGVSAILTLLIPYYDQDPNAPLPHAFKTAGLSWIGSIVAAGALVGLSSSLLGAMFPLPRIIYAMCSDGLLPKWLGTVNSRFQTPLVATILCGLFSGIVSALFDLKNLVDMMSIGTLMAYTLVGICVCILRYSEPLEFDKRRRSSSSIDSFICDDESDKILDITELDRIEDDSSTYKDWMLQSFNASKLRNPNKLSSTVASFWIWMYSGECMLFLWLIETDYRIKNVLSVFTFLGMIFSLICISRQPMSKADTGFKIPLVPWFPALSVFLNLYLMSKLSSVTWIRFVVWMALGLFNYAVYGWRNSNEEESYTR